MPLPTTTELTNALKGVRSLSFTACGEGGWTGRGTGGVLVEEMPGAGLLFTETGDWRNAEGRRFRFRNVYRWSPAGAEAMRLEHLRFGPDRPVHLFDLLPRDENVWISADPHQCAEDCYAAELTLRPEGFRLQWIVSGPKRRDSIDYEYFRRANFEPA